MEGKREKGCCEHTLLFFFLYVINSLRSVVFAVGFLVSRQPSVGVQSDTLGAQALDPLVALVPQVAPVAPVLCQA